MQNIFFSQRPRQIHARISIQNEFQYIGNESHKLTNDQIVFVFGFFYAGTLIPRVTVASFTRPEFIIRKKEKEKATKEKLAYLHISFFATCAQRFRAARSLSRPSSNSGPTDLNGWIQGIPYPDKEERIEHLKNKQVIRKATVECFRTVFQRSVKDNRQRIVMIAQIT